MCGLQCWSHLLKGTAIPVLVFTDHNNLHYYRDPRKIGPWVTGYLPEREQLLRSWGSNFHFSSAY